MAYIIVKKRPCFVKLIICTFVISFFCISLYGAQKREFRGAWIHIVGNNIIRTMSTAKVQRMFVEALDSIESAGCNAVIFQIRPTADAFYSSSIEPWSRYLTGVQGKTPEPFWDPLKFMIDECHKRGMEIHAWCNPYRVTLNSYDTLCSNHIYFTNPNIFVKYGKQIYFNPGEPASRDFTVKVVADIVRRYNIDAIHFDDYFYPYPIAGVKFNDDAAFAKYAAKQGFLNRADWRRYNVELLIKEINDTVKMIKPWVRFGISPFGIHRNKKDTPNGTGSDTNGLSNYDELFADVPNWAAKGYIDYYVPQLYWEIGHKRADFKTLIKWWDKQHIRGQLYIGQSISTMKKQIKHKIELSRNLKNISGNVWWPGWSIVANSNKIADSLRLKYQKYKALVPAYSQLDSVLPCAIENITKMGRVIEWQQNLLDVSNPMQQALFYAIYCFPKGVQADITNNKYLLKLTPNSTFNVIEENPQHVAGCSYVITVIDRCWNESKPSKIMWF
ncbi:MAG: family 10 glycosylhydrolase [Bacteroidales bacterium]